MLGFDVFFFTFFSFKILNVLLSHIHPLSPASHFGGGGLNVDNTASVVMDSIDQHVLVKADHTCGSVEEALGDFSTVDQCASACVLHTDCTYFTYGKAALANQNKCFYETTTSDGCDETFASDSTYDFYKVIESKTLVRFENNVAASGEGGGMSFPTGSPLILTSKHVFTGNTAGTSGGAIAFLNGKGSDTDFGDGNCVRITVTTSGFIRNCNGLQISTLPATLVAHAIKSKTLWNKQKNFCIPCGSYALALKNAEATLGGSNGFGPTAKIQITRNTPNGKTILESVISETSGVVSSRLELTCDMQGILLQNGLYTTNIAADSGGALSTSVARKNSMFTIHNSAFVGNKVTNGKGNYAVLWWFLCCHCVVVHVFRVKWQNGKTAKRQKLIL